MAAFFQLLGTQTPREARIGIHSAAICLHSSHRIRQTYNLFLLSDHPQDCICWYLSNQEQGLRSSLRENLHIQIWFNHLHATVSANFWGDCCGQPLQPNQSMPGLSQSRGSLQSLVLINKDEHKNHSLAWTSRRANGFQLSNLLQTQPTTCHYH